MTERFINPISKFTTDTLQSLPYAKLYFYINSSTTPKTVYHDINKATPWTQPVIADSAGNFPEIFLDGTYRVELKSTDGITQTGWPIDNVGAVGSAQAFGSWSSIITYSQYDLVTGSNGVRYESLSNGNLNNDPTISPTFWREVRFSNLWNAANTYALNDRAEGSDYFVYVSIQANNKNHDPLTSGDWWVKEKDSFFWNSQRTYAVNDRAYVGEIRYISLQNANINKNPAANPLWWAEDLATIIYVDTATKNRDFNGFKGINSAAPSNSGDLANKGYVDAVAASGSAAVSLVTTATIIKYFGGF